MTVSSRSTVSSNALPWRTGRSTPRRSTPVLTCHSLRANGRRSVKRRISEVSWQDLLTSGPARPSIGLLLDHLCSASARPRSTRTRRRPKEHVVSVNDQVSAVTLSDEEMLHKLGYAQELRRRMSGFSNFAVSFTIISILSGCLTLYSYGMNTGGPAVIVWGWPIVGIMTLFVGMAMAEVTSSYPTAGGLYYFAAKLARKNGAAWSWFTGWFNFLGQVAVTAGIDFGAAFFINAFLNIQFGLGLAHWETILIFAIVLLVHGLLNQFGIKLVALLNDISVWWHILGVLIIVGVLVFAPSHHSTGGFVFTHFVSNTGWGSSFYVVLIGLLLAQYTFTGYDASAHMTEETHKASTAGPRGIVMSIIVSLFAGWILLIGVTYAIQNYTKEVGATVAPAQIFVDAVGS